MASIIWWWCMACVVLFMLGIVGVQLAWQLAKLMAVIALACLFLFIAGCGDDDSLYVQPEPADPRPPSRTELCEHLLIPLIERTWDEERQIYIPEAVAWYECMGVGVDT